MDPRDGTESRRDDTDDLFEDPVLLAALDARGHADLAAGRVLGTAAVVMWLKTWGTEPTPWR